MKITIVGGGNIGTQFAVHSAERGDDVTIYTSTPDVFSKRLVIVDESGIVTHGGTIAGASNNPRVAFSKADFIMVTVPAKCMEDVASKVVQFASEEAIIGVVPGTGGSECAFHRCIERGNVFFAIERVPAIARLVEKGKAVRSVGYRDRLNIASIPADRVGECCELIHGIYGQPCIPIPCLLNLTMTPSNPILHTTRLRMLFSDYHEGVIYSSVPLFYEEWDNASSELLLACDEEVQSICRALPQFRLNYVRSLKTHYESPTVEAMTRKISGIKAFKGLETPTLRVEGGYIPNLHSRYFTSDFSYGLRILCQIAGFAGVKTPNLDSTLAWYDQIAVERDCFDYGKYGIRDLETLEDFYLR